LKRCLFLFRYVDLCEELSRLLALPLHHFPSRLDRHHLAGSDSSTMRCLLRSGLCLFLSGCRFRERAKNNFWIPHTALHSVDRGSHAVSALASQVLCDAKLFVAEHAGQKLATPGGCHRRHHRQLLLRGEIRVKEFRHRHSKPALH